MSVRLSMLVLALSLAACAAPQLAPDRYYRLDTAADAPPIAQPLDVMLESFDAHGVVAERQLIYRRLEAGGAVEQYRQQFWAEPPARMLTDGLHATLRRALGAEQVHGRNSRTRADWVLRPRLRRLEQELDASGAQARLAIDFLVTNEDNEPRFVLSFDEAQPAASTAPGDFTRAAEQLAAQANLRLVERLAQEFAR